MLLNACFDNGKQQWCKGELQVAGLEWELVNLIRFGNFSTAGRWICLPWLFGVNGDMVVMNAKLAKILSAIGLSMVRHTFGGVPLAAGYGFSYLEVACYTSLGGIMGMSCFLLLASSFAPTLRRWFPKKPGRKIFSRRNRFIVKVKKNFGLTGIAFLTPGFLSIPFGTILAFGIYKDRNKVFLYQSCAIIFWSFLGAGLAQPIASLFLD